MWMEGMIGPPFPVVHDQLLCLADFKGVGIILAPHCQVTDLLLIGCLIDIGDQANQCCFVNKLNDSAGVVRSQEMEMGV
jgi:hypothetical protein